MDELLNIVTVGHVDHGKSTVIGRLLADAGALPEGKLESIRENCRRNSKPFEYAFLLDALKNEREQGITYAPRQREAVALAGRVGDLLRWMGIRTQISTRNVRQLMVMEYYSSSKAQRELAFAVSPIKNAIADFFSFIDADKTE